jgi:hypothetical protein
MGMKIRWWAYAILALCWGMLAAGPAWAGQRVALVIGNSKYRNVERLPKTINDAMGMVALFHKAGFDVVKWRVDLDVAEFRRTVHDFMVTAQSADIAVVYYAGHGIEKGGTNYLIPVDAKLQTDYDADDEAISLDRIILALQPARQLRLIILDACRQNPFSSRGSRTIVTRAITNGLAKIEPMTPDTLIAYAAKAGSLSYEGNGPNSPFTTALMKYLAEPGIDIRIALGKVRDEVVKNTGNRQEPFVYGSLGGDEVSLVPAPEPKVSGPAAAAVDPNLAVVRDYEMAEKVQTREVWEAFLELHKSGFYANLAQAQLAKLLAMETATEAVQNTDEILGLLGERSPSGQAAKPVEVRHDEPAGTADSHGQGEGLREQERQAALVQGKGESVQDCKDAEERLGRLRKDPKPEEVVRFARDLVCETLRPQLQRLLESLGPTVTPPPATALAAPTQQPEGAPATRPPRSGTATPEENNARGKKGDRSDTEDACKRDETTLMNLRAIRDREEVIRFDRNLACEQLRPQITRLLESIGN